MLLPFEILSKILRLDKKLFSLSRTVCKSIRNLSLYDILQHEMLYPLIEQETWEIGDLDNSTLIENHIFEDIDDYGRSLNCMRYVIPFYDGSPTNTDNCLSYVSTLRDNNLYDRTITTSHSNFTTITYLEKINKEISDYDEHTYDVDFLSYHYLMINRLSLYNCDKNKLAFSLMMNRFNEMSKSDDKDYFLLLLYGTAIVGNIPIETPINIQTLNELTPKIKEILMNKFNEI